MVLRPIGVVIDGRLEHGLAVEVDSGGTIVRVFPSSEAPDSYVLCVAFVNAHSHLEYRGLQGKLRRAPYFEWIRAITAAKRTQAEAQIREDCLLAALENRQSGVGYIAEHSDRPYAGEAMGSNGIAGVIFQEVITFLESAGPAEKLAQVAEGMRRNASRLGGEVHINPHAPWTVDEATLRAIAEAGGLVSIHVAESVHENDYFQFDKGPIAALSREAGVSRTLGLRVVDYLAGLGYLRPGVQFVHCCDVNPEEIAKIASAGVSVAHCPRSNEALDCPRAPVREMLDAGVLVGLGLDSAASSGPIDMFAEMRSCLDVAIERGAELTPEEVWRMATTMGAESLQVRGWDVSVGATAPLIRIRIEDAENIRDVIESCSPRNIEWVDPLVDNC